MVGEMQCKWFAWCDGVLRALTHLSHLLPRPYSTLLLCSALLPSPLSSVTVTEAAAGTIRVLQNRDLEAGAGAGFSVRNE